MCTLDIFFWWLHSWEWKPGIVEKRKQQHFWYKKSDSIWFNKSFLSFHTQQPLLEAPHKTCRGIILAPPCQSVGYAVGRRQPDQILEVLWESLPFLPTNMLSWHLCPVKCNMGAYITVWGVLCLQRLHARISCYALWGCNAQRTGWGKKQLTPLSGAYSSILYLMPAYGSPSASKVRHCR